jgi:hypothetical protein
VEALERRDRHALSTELAGPTGREPPAQVQVIVDLVPAPALVGALLALVEVSAAVALAPLRARSRAVAAARSRVCCLDGSRDMIRGALCGVVVCGRASLSAQDESEQDIQIAPDARWWPGSLGLDGSYTKRVWYACHVAQSRLL